MAGVDVVVPCYNYARFLPRCVNSVLQQDAVDVRVLIIDDTSTDETPQVGAELAAKDSRVQFVRHARNAGHIATYNEGLLHWASAEYSVLLSADDMITPGSLARATRLMDAHPEMGLAYGPAFIITDDDSIPSIGNDPDSRHRIIPSEAFLERCFLNGNPVPTPSAIVRTALQKELGGYAADLPFTGDMEMWMRFAARGPVGFIQAPQSYYRRHAQSMTSRQYASILSDRRETYSACERVASAWKTLRPRVTELQEKAKRRLAHDVMLLAGAAFDDGDKATSDEAMRVAALMSPEEYAQSHWWKLKLKRRLPSSLWKRARNFAKALTPRPPDEQALARSAGARQIGWIPG